MAPVRGTRCDPATITWRCKAGHENIPDRFLLFDLPKFLCECGCGEKFRGDFEFSMADIKANGYRLVGEPLDQGMSDYCVAFGYAKQLEISRKVKELVQNRDPNSVPAMSPKDLVIKYKARMAGLEGAGLSAAIHMGLIIKEQGMLSEDENILYKISDVSTIKRDDRKSIARALANGYPLHAGIYVGKRLGGLKYCKSYKPPSISRFGKKKRFPESHAVVLIGAGRKRRKWYYFFMNSWRNFCWRRTCNGMKLRDGVGKVRADRLWRNVIRISRFKESTTFRSLEHQHSIEITEKNMYLIR